MSHISSVPLNSQMSNISEPQSRNCSQKLTLKLPKPSTLHMKNSLEQQKEFEGGGKKQEEQEQEQEGQEEQKEQEKELQQDCTDGEKNIPSRRVQNITEKNGKLKLKISLKGLEDDENGNYSEASNNTDTNTLTETQESNNITSQMNPPIISANTNSVVGNDDNNPPTDDDDFPDESVSFLDKILTQTRRNPDAFFNDNSETYDDDDEDDDEIFEESNSFLDNVISQTGRNPVSKSKDDLEASSDVFDDDENEIAEVLMLAENQKQLKNHRHNNDESTDGEKQFIVTLKIPTLGKKIGNALVSNANNTSILQCNTISGESIPKYNEPQNNNENKDSNIPNNRSSSAFFPDLPLQNILHMTPDLHSSGNIITNDIQSLPLMNNESSVTPYEDIPLINIPSILPSSQPQMNHITQLIPQMFDGSNNYNYSLPSDVHNCNYSLPTDVHNLQYHIKNQLDELRKQSIHSVLNNNKTITKTKPKPKPKPKSKPRAKKAPVRKRKPKPEFHRQMFLLPNQLGNNAQIPAQNLINNSDDDDIVEESLQLSLKDPVSGMRISMPLRSRFCSHLECFDYKYFLDLYHLKPFKIGVRRDPPLTNGKPNILSILKDTKRQLINSKVHNKFTCDYQYKNKFKLIKEKKKCNEMEYFCCPICNLEFSIKIPGDVYVLGELADLLEELNLEENMEDVEKLEIKRNGDWNWVREDGDDHKIKENEIVEIDLLDSEDDESMDERNGLTGITNSNDNINTTDNHINTTGNNMTNDNNINTTGNNITITNNINTADNINYTANNNFDSSTREDGSKSVDQDSMLDQLDELLDFVDVEEEVEIEENTPPPPLPPPLNLPTPHEISSMSDKYTGVFTFRPEPFMENLADNSSANNPDEKQHVFFSGNGYADDPFVID